MSAYLREKIFVSDIAADPRWADYRDFALSLNLRACWSSPIYLSRQKILGAFALYSNRSRDISPEEERIIDQFSHLASIVIERKYADDALRKSEAMMAQAQKMSRTGNWVWNLETGKLRWSDEQKRIFGFPTDFEDLTFDVFMETVHPDDRAPLLRVLEEAVGKNSFFDVEFRIVLGDGTIKFIQGSGLPVFDDAGKTIAYMGPVMDFTERKRVEDELRLSEENLRKAHSDLAHVTRLTTMGELTASIAHEVSQPLTGIVMGGNAGLRWLNGDSPNLEEARESIRSVIHEGKRAGEVITRIRKLFKKEELVKEPLIIDDVIGEVLAFLRNNLQQHRIRKKVDLATDIPPVLGDRVQIQQVLMNLILNAIDAMNAVDVSRRELVITTRAAGERKVSVEVRDSGIGIAPRDQEKIFETFHTTKPGGMGMGLAICRSIVTSHGGELKLVPPRGCGATFRFTLATHRNTDSDD